MLRKPIDEIVYDKNGKVMGVKSQGETAKCKQLISDPTYFLKTDKVKSIGRVARWLCILGAPVPGTERKNKPAESAQIILPAKQVCLYVYVCMCVFVCLCVLVCVCVCVCVCV